MYLVSWLVAGRNIKETAKLRLRLATNMFRSCFMKSESDWKGEPEVIIVTGNGKNQVKQLEYSNTLGSPTHL